MNAADIIGYAFNGAEYCVSCAYKARRVWNAKCECKRSDRDENGLCAENCDGYGPNPIFGDSEDAGSCDTCGEALIEEWDGMPDGTYTGRPHGGGFYDRACGTCGAVDGAPCAEEV